MTTGIEHCVRVHVRYWAGARAAAGVENESYDADTVAGLVEQMKARHPALAPVLEVASLLVDGLAAPLEARLTSDQNVEVLPPFAGG